MNRRRWTRRLVVLTAGVLSGSLLAWADAAHAEAARAQAAGATPGSAIALVSSERPHKDAKRRAEAWLGVRVAPVPDALKAHLGRDGIMIANVVVDGPADQAGLKRYDLIVEFAGREIRSFQDLRDALAGMRPGQRARMRIIREAREQTLRVRVGRRPKRGTELKLKYREPQQARELMRYFGGRLSRGPGGQWEFEPLGRLRNLLPGMPDENELENARRDLDEAMQQLQQLPQLLEQLGELLPYEDLNTLEQDAEKLEEMARDLEQRVEKFEQGNWSALADFDWQAFFNGPLMKWIDLGAAFWPERGGDEDPNSVAPGEWPQSPKGWMQLLRQQREFQTRLREALRRQRSSSDRGRRTGRAAREAASHKARQHTDRHVKLDQENGRILVIDRDEDGIRVYVIGGDDKIESHRFSSLAELRRTMPEIYDQVRKLLGDEED